MSLVSISTCCPASAHSPKKEKGPVFHPRSWGSSTSSSLFVSPLLLLPIWWWQSGHYTIFTLSELPPSPPSTGSIPLCCPLSFPVTPPQRLGYYELYYFDPGPSICFNWIMICNHILSGESIKRAGASAPLLRGLLLFPNPRTHTQTHTQTCTHLIQALFLSAFRPPLNTLGHGHYGWGWTFYTAKK